MFQHFTKGQPRLQVIVWRVSKFVATYPVKTRAKHRKNGWPSITKDLPQTAAVLFLILLLVSLSVTSIIILEGF